jgi:tetratricopeptide (TPR) repeat protein
MDRSKRVGDSGAGRGRPAPALRGAAGARRPASTPPVSSPDRALIREVRESAAPRDRDRAEEAFVRAVLALANDDATAALDAATEAKGLAPRAPVVREVIGIASYRAGRYRDAISALGAYRRMTGRTDQNHLIADAYRATGNPEKAVPLIREELAADIPGPLRAEATVVGASALADLGRFDEAVALLAAYPAQQDVATDHDLRVWYVWGDVLERAGRAQEAALMFEQVARHDPDAFDVRERLEAL